MPPLRHWIFFTMLIRCTPQGTARIGGMQPQMLHPIKVVPGLYKPPPS